MNASPSMDPFARGVLLVSPEPWDSLRVSKHHYAMVLAARGSSVFFLNPPDGSVDGIRIQAVSAAPGLHVVSAPRVASGLRFYPAFLRRWLEARWLRRFERQAGCRIDTIWLFENSRFYGLRFAGSRLKIYHQVDLNQTFHPITAAATADICFCTTDFIRDQLVPHAKHVYKIHHGLAEIESPSRLSDEQTARFTGSGAQGAYIGNLDMSYLDAELLADTARSCPNVRFHFVGGYSEAGQLWQLAGNLPNVMWWGKVDSALIPAILEHADVLLVTYKAALYREQLASPHKFMEYLASGKTIVATYTDEYKDQRHLLEMVDDNAEYLAAFERVINDLDVYNSPDRQAERKAFAQAHSYTKQLDRIFALLRQHKLLID
ncbi:MAG: glycosyltransferase [Limnohabitans sp.]